MEPSAGTRNPTLYSAFLESAQRNAERTFIKDGAMALSFSGTLALASGTAKRLREAYGIGRDDRVGVLVSNRIEYVVTVLALNKLGACFMPLNRMYTQQDILDIADAAGMKLLLYERAFEKTVCDDAVYPSLAVEDISSGRTAQSDSAFEPQDVAAIFFTSGTTGSPKGVMLGNDTFFNCAKIISEGSEYDYGMKQLVIAPLHHVFPFHNQLAPGILMGHTLYLANYESVAQVLEIMEKERIEVLQAAPSLFTLIHMSGLHIKHPLPYAKLFGYSGAPMNKEVISALQKAFPHVHLVNSYGASESGGTVAVLPAREALEREDCVGRAGPGVDIRVLDPDDRIVTGEIGEIVVKTVCMKGYVNADSSDRFFGGYLRTGDAGTVTADGYVYVKGRVDDMMIVNGTNVYPADVERYFAGSDMIRDISVAARKSVFGDQIVAFVVLSKTVERPEAKLRAFAEKNVPEYKRPMDYIVLDEIPRSEVGKVVQSALQALL